MFMLVGTGEAVNLELCSFRECVGGKQTSLIRVSGTVARDCNHGRAANDVIHQDLRAIGENSAAERQERFGSRRSGLVLHDLTIQVAVLILMEFRQTRKDQRRTARRRIAGKRAGEDDVSVSSKKEFL